MLNIKINRVSMMLNILITLIFSSIFIVIIGFVELNLKQIGFMSILIYSMFFLSWFSCFKVRLNFYTIFLSFTYMFYFGQFLLLFLGVPMSSGRTIIDDILPYENLVNTSRFVLVFMIIMNFSVLSSSFNLHKYTPKISIKHKTKDVLTSVYAHNFKKVALVLFIISVVPSFIILIQNILITFELGYGAIFKSDNYTQGGFNNILRFVSKFTIPSFIMMLISFKNDRKLKYIVFIICVYLTLYFLSGSRLNGVLLISSMVLIKHIWYSPITRKQGLILLVGALLGAIFLSSISEIRNAFYVSSDISQLIKDVVSGVLKENPFVLIFEEAGYTFLSISTVLTYSPSVVEHYNGMSYINSIFMLVPNLFWDVHPAAQINTDIIFKSYLSNYGGIGSSFISEAYWNFGYYSLILAILYGALIGFLVKSTFRNVSKNNFVKVYLAIYISQISLFYVRSDTVSFWRNFVYYGLGPLLVVYLLTLTSKRGEKDVSECSE